MPGAHRPWYISSCRGLLLHLCCSTGWHSCTLTACSAATFVPTFSAVSTPRAVPYWFQSTRQLLLWRLTNRLKKHYFMKARGHSHLKHFMLWQSFSDQALPGPVCSDDRGRRTWTPEVRMPLSGPCTPGSPRCSPQCGQRAETCSDEQLYMVHRENVITVCLHNSCVLPLLLCPAWSPVGCCRSCGACSRCVSFHSALEPAAPESWSPQGPKPRSPHVLMRTIQVPIRALMNKNLKEQLTPVSQ